MYKRTFLILLIISLFTVPAYAAKIVLTSGKTVEGSITAHAKDHITIQVLDTPITYYFDEIDTIDGIKPAAPSVPSPEEKDVVNKETADQLPKPATVPVEIPVDAKTKPGLDMPVQMDPTPPAAAPIEQSSFYHSDQVGVTVAAIPGWNIEETHLKSIYSLGLRSKNDLISIQLLPFFINNINNAVAQGMVQGIQKTALTPIGAFAQPIRPIDFKGTPAYRSEILRDGGNIGYYLIFEKNGGTFVVLVLSVDDPAAAQRIVNSIQIDQTLPRRAIKPGLILFFLIIGSIAVIWDCLAYFFIARKMDIKPSWLALIPLANQFLVCKMVEMPYAWLSFFLLFILGASLMSANVILGVLALVCASIQWMIFIAISRHKLLVALNMPGWLAIPQE